MNHFRELEDQLKTLRPTALREDFVARVEQSMNQEPAAHEPPANVVRPVQFRRQWMLGLSLAAAAALLLLVRANFRPPHAARPIVSQPSVSQLERDRPANGSALHTPASAGQPALPNVFVPAGATQVVYHRRDEGLLFAQNSDQPLRRMRSTMRETLEFRNPATGASIQVSYPSEQVELVPISAQ